MLIYTIALGILFSLYVRLCADFVVVEYSTHIAFF